MSGRATHKWTDPIMVVVFPQDLWCPIDHRSITIFTLYCDTVTDKPERKETPTTNEKFQIQSPEAEIPCLAHLSDFLPLYTYYSPGVHYWTMFFKQQKKIPKWVIPLDWIIFCLNIKSLWNVYEVIPSLRAEFPRRIQRPWTHLGARLRCLVIDIWEALLGRILTALTSHTLIIRNCFPDDNTLRMRAFLKNQTRLAHPSEVSFPNEIGRGEVRWEPSQGWWTPQSQECI